MMPDEVRALFWDVDLEEFTPEDHPDHAIFRALEFGNTEAVAWMRRTYSHDEIRRVLRHERRLSPKPANFWGLVYKIPLV